MKTNLIVSTVGKKLTL